MYNFLVVSLSLGLLFFLKYFAISLTSLGNFTGIEGGKLEIEASFFSFLAVFVFWDIIDFRSEFQCNFIPKQHAVVNTKSVPF